MQFIRTDLRTFPDQPHLRGKHNLCWTCLWWYQYTKKVRYETITSSISVVFLSRSKPTTTDTTPMAFWAMKSVYIDLCAVFRSCHCYCVESLLLDSSKSRVPWAEAWRSFVYSRSRSRISIHIGPPLTGLGLVLAYPSIVRVIGHYQPVSTAEDSVCHQN